MVFEEAVASAVQVVLASWVAIITAGAGTLFVQQSRLRWAVAELQRQAKQIETTLTLVARFADTQRLSDAEDDEEGDAPAQG